MTDLPFAADPELDLVLEREIEVPTSLVWAAWTEPEHIVHWFAPAPWSVSHCEIDLRPGGLFRTTMRSPEGEEFPSDGCFLDVQPQRRLVFTDALLPGYRPAAEPFFTAVVTMEPTDTGTKYRAMAIHGTTAARQRHEEMGFFEGWNAALDQLVAHAATM